MTRLLFAIVLVGVLLVGLGFWLGWFQVGSRSADGQDHITLTIDERKIQEDEKKTLQKVHDVGRQAHDRVAGPAEKTKD